MPKIPTSAIGIDLGRYSMKSVLLQRRDQGRFALTHYATRRISDSALNSEQLAHHLKLLLKEMGGRAKAAAVSVSSASSIMRLIEQPETPKEILRDALRLNGVALLNQDCKDFVLDCDTVKPNGSNGSSGERIRYLVVGLPRIEVTRIHEAFVKNRSVVNAVQLAPVSAFNAFEFADPENFSNSAFILVDIGHLASTVTVGAKKELILTRTIEFGGKDLLEAVEHSVAVKGEAALRLLQERDEIAVDAARLALTALSREISSSIGYFEGQREETISRIFLSGGVAKSSAVGEILSQDLGRPCSQWDVFERCEVSISGARKEKFTEDAPSLNIACGAAAELLQEA